MHAFMHACMHIYTDTHIYDTHIQLIHSFASVEAYIQTAIKHHDEMRTTTTPRENHRTRLRAS